MLPMKLVLGRTAYTGNSAFLRPDEIFCNAICMYGPMIGMLPAKEPIVAKKSPNSMKIP